MSRIRRGRASRLQLPLRTRTRPLHHILLLLLITTALTRPINTTPTHTRSNTTPHDDFHQLPRRPTRPTKLLTPLIQLDSNRTRGHIKRFKHDIKPNQSRIHCRTGTRGGCRRGDDEGFGGDQRLSIVDAGM